MEYVKKSFIVIAMLTLISCATAPRYERAQWLDPENVTSKDYARMANKIKDGWRDIEFTRLRMAYMKSKSYRKSISDENKDIKGAYTDMNSKAYSQCLAKVETILEYNLTSLAAHFAAFQCSRAIGDNIKAAFHQYMLNGLMDSVSSSGDGLTEASAYISLSTYEALWYVRLLSLQIVSEDFIKRDNVAFEKLGLLEPVENDRFDFYFDVTGQFFRK